MNDKKVDGSMSVLERLTGVVDYKRYLRRLLLSTALAVLTVYIAFGLMYFAREGNRVPGPFILLTFATFFILFTVFYESKVRGKSKGKERKRAREQGKESVKALIRGLFLGCCATFAFIAIIAGVLLMLEMLEDGFELIGGFGAFISALAICMAVSMVLLSLFRPAPS
jgi:hypothetical protein